MSKAKQKASTRLHWHPEAHRVLSGSRLYFWFYRFATLSSREDVLAALFKVADDFQIRSYATYELIGPFDLLARFYMRPEDESRFKEACEEALRPYNLKHNQPFQVKDMPRNWVWAGGPGRAGPPTKPAEEVLEQHYSRAQIELINDAENTSHERRRLLKRFKDIGLLTRQVQNEGIKFVVTVSTEEDLAGRTLTLLRQRLERALDQAPSALRERSLYAGRDSQHQIFLIMCRIRADRFHKIRELLLEPLGEAGAPAQASTTTYTVISEDFVCYQDHLTTPAPRRSDGAALLQGSETGQFEAKGTLALDLKPWLEGAAELEELKESKSLPREGVLKSIVGLLNSGGGTVVVGALEEAAYADDPVPAELLAALPQVGGYRILGLVDPTYRRFGWDKWDLKLRSLIRSRIEPNPGVLIESREEEVEGRKICVIDIDDPGDEGEFYLRVGKNDSVFYGREGTQVHRIKGPDIKRHRDQVRQRRVNQSQRK
jgi:hypothetical protein